MNNKTLEQQLYDVYGIEYVPWWHSTIFYVVLGAVACVMIGAMIYWLVQRYRVRYQNRAAWEIALHSLDELSKKYMRPEDSRIFYYTLTDIIKNYLYERYGYYVIDKTDEECIAYLANTDFPRELYVLLEAMLRAGKMSKFAYVQASEQQMRDHIAAGRYIIKLTIPQRAD